MDAAERWEGVIYVLRRGVDEDEGMRGHGMGTMERLVWAWHMCAPCHLMYHT